MLSTSIRKLWRNRRRRKTRKHLLESLEARQLLATVQLYSMYNTTTEGSTETASFEFYRDDPTGELPVDIMISGSADEYMDYTISPDVYNQGTYYQQVTFADGDSYAYLEVTALTDNELEYNETVELYLNSGDGSYTVDSWYYYDSLTIEDPPTVSLYDYDMYASEEGDYGMIQFYRTDSSGYMEVDFSISGTATLDTDYYSSDFYEDWNIPGTYKAYFYNGSSYADVYIYPYSDGDVEGTETATFTLSLPSDNSYLVDQYSTTANVYIEDAGPLVSLSATDMYATEDGDPGQYTLTRSDATGDLTVYVSDVGNAAPGTDYTTNYGDYVYEVNFLDGDYYATVDIFAYPDIQSEADYVQLELYDSSEYQVDWNQYYDYVYITDSEKVVSMWSDDAAATEDSTDDAQLTLYRSGSTNSLTVYVETYDGLGTDYSVGDDTHPIPGVSKTLSGLQ